LLEDAQEGRKGVQTVTSKTQEEHGMSFIKRLLADESGQDLAEYGIALAVIAVAAGGIAVAISGDVGVLWANAQTAVHSAL
jgi:Flp pilus assembly pilin Flp